MTGDRRELQNFVGGQYTATAEGATEDVVNPSTGEPFATMPVSGPTDVDRAFAVAQGAFETWRETTPSERSLALFRLADAVEARAGELVDAECENTGKPRALTLSEEIPPMVDQIRFFASACRLLEGRSAGEYMRGFTSFVRREPVGVCAQVTPWNYPMMMAIWKFAPAIAAGNAVVLKPAHTTPVSTLLLAEIAAEFLPPGVLNVVCGNRETGRALVAHPVPQMVSITGSVRAGREVAISAAEDVKRVHLELGGKAPVVVFDDVDVAAAAEGIAIAGYFNAGQDCTAATRVLAGPGVHDELAAALVERALAQTVAGPEVEGADFGPLNSADQLGRVRSFVEGLPDHAPGARPGASSIGDRGFFYEPTVVSDVRQEDDIIQQEVFGPVITVQRFHRRGPGRGVGQRRGVRIGIVGVDTRITPGPCAWPSGSTSGACGSTPTSPWWRRCPTEGSGTRGTARTCRCTGSRTTRASSTSCRPSTGDRASRPQATLTGRRAVTRPPGRRRGCRVPRRADRRG